MTAVASKKPAALVTGASRGIGAAIAETLAADGFPVFIHYVKQRTPAEALAAKITAAGGRAATGTADLATPEAAAKLVAMARQQLGSIGVVVNNAADAVIPRPIVATPWEQMQRALDVILRAAYTIAQAARSDMANAHWGRVVNVATAYVWDAPPPGLAPYVTAKHALVGLTRAMAAEWGIDGVTVNCVSPSLVETDMTAHLPISVKTAVIQQTPIRRLITATDVAQIVRMLCAASGDGLTGANVPVTGGLRMP